MIKRFEILALIVGLIVAVLGASEPEAAAAQSCPAGSVLVDGICYTISDPTPILADCVAPYVSFAGEVCKTSNPNPTNPTLAPQYVCPAGPAGVTVTPATHVLGGVTKIAECSYPRPLVLQCPAGSELVSGQCRGLIGKVTLTYTVDCVSDGFARLSLGTPVIENGASISLITVNGSAGVGVDIPGGSTIDVQIVTEDETDIIVVNGPETAPACTSEEPTATATATGAPTATPAATATPTATAGPEPTATATALPPTPTPTATSAPEPTSTPVPTTAAEPEPTTPPPPTTGPEPTTPPPPTTAAEPVPASPTCAPGEALLDGRCLPPCPEGDVAASVEPDSCYQLAQTQTEAETPVATTSSDDGVPILPIAAGAALVAGGGGLLWFVLNRGAKEPTGF